MKRNVWHGVDLDCDSPAYLERLRRYPLSFWLGVVKRQGEAA